MSDKSVPKDLTALIVWPAYFYKQQTEFMESPKWQRWFIAGNGTGKTLMLYWNIVAYLIGVHPKQFAPPPIKCRVVVPSFDHVADVALAKLFDNQTIQPHGIDIGSLLPERLVQKPYSRDHKGLDLVNGSTLDWVTSEQGWQFMRGYEFDLLAVDEECDERVFDENKRGLRNAKGGGKIIGGLTPPYEEGQGPTWTKEKVLDAKDPDIDVFNACMADNPAITPQFIERFSKGKTQQQVKVQIYGEYPTWGDLVHPDFQDTIWDPKALKGHLLGNDTPMPESWDVDWVMAFDWHPSKPCAAVFGWIDRDGNVVIFDELDKDVALNKTIDELADTFRSIEGHPFHRRRFRRWQDPSAKSDYNAVQRGFNAWDAFRKAGIITAAGRNRDPEVGISIVNEYFRGNCREHPRIFIYERCTHLRKYLKNHFWKRGTDGVGKPDPKWSDYPICLRYILQEVGWKPAKFLQKQWPLVSYGKLQPEKRTIDLGKWF